MKSPSKLRSPSRPRAPAKPKPPPAKRAKAEAAPKSTPSKRAKNGGDKTEESPRVARRERRRDRSREEIVEAARRVLVREGTSGTTLEAVAREVGLTKAALYYYYPSKDALFFEIIFSAVEAQSQAIHDAVTKATSNAEVLRAIVRETVHAFAPRMDDFRLTYLHGQVGGPGAVRINPEQLTRIRPLNDLAYGSAAKRLSQGGKRGRAGVEPRLLAFLANISAIGLLTMKGMVEAVGDPLLYSDEELIEGLARIFEVAASP